MLSRYTYCRARNFSIGLRFLFIIQFCLGVKASEHVWRKTPQKMLGVSLSTSSKTISRPRYTTTTVPHLSRPGDITSRSSLQYVSRSVPVRTYDGVALTDPSSSMNKTSSLPAGIACAHGLLVPGGFSRPPGARQVHQGAQTSSSVTWYRGDGVVSLAMMNRVRPVRRCCWCGRPLLSCGCGHRAGGGPPVQHDGGRLFRSSRSSGPCKAARRPRRSHQGSSRRGRGRHEHCSRAAPINCAAIPL